MVCCTTGTAKRIFWLEEFDESVYTTHAPQDVSQLNIDDIDNDESCVREDCEGALVWLFI